MKNSRHCPQLDEKGRTKLPSPLPMTTSSNLRIFAVVAFYNIAAIAATIVNKHYLRTIPLPLTLLWLQMLIGTGLLGFGRSFQTHKQSLTLPARTRLRLLGPMVLSNVAGLALNILCLQKIDAIMHQITRSMTLPLAVLLGPIMGTEPVSWRLLGVCMAVVCGFVIAVSGESLAAANWSVWGLGAGIVSSLINALNAQNVKNNFMQEIFSALDLVFYNNLYSCVLLGPIALAWEWHTLSRFKHFHHLWTAAWTTGILGLCINYAGFLQIQVTSAVTHCASAAARGIFQFAASHVFLKESVTASRTTGLSIALFATAIYPLVKSYENRRQQQIRRPYQSSKVKDIPLKMISPTSTIHSKAGKA